MKTVYSEKHLFHTPREEFSLGKMTPCFEKKERAQYVYDAVKARNFGAFLPPEAFPLSAILAVHDAEYIQFLKSAHAEWQAEGYDTDAFASAFNVQHPGARAPKHIDGKLGFYMADGTVPLTATSWQAIEASAHVALTAQKIVAGGERAAFALCRPPGHHATAGVAAGYCFVNNAAVAAQAFIEQGAKRVALLDIDYHHGNGTQEIFYERDDVLFLSIHADPAVDYPYFLGYEDEKGRGRGEGYNVNYALPYGTDFVAWKTALDDALAKMAAYAPDAVVISLGVDTFKGDPISKFLLESEDYLRIGAGIAGLKKPTLFVMEGGYAVEDIGINVANVLSGFVGG